MSSVSLDAAVLLAAVESTLHRNEHWVGAAAEPDGEVHVADLESVTPFVLDAGDATWGEWVLLLGSEDTPLFDGNGRYSPHRIFIIDTERAGVHRFQFAFGEDADAALVPGDYSGLIYSPASPVVEEAGLPIRSDWQDSGTKLWARVWADGFDTGTVSLLIGLHEEKCR